MLFPTLIGSDMKKVAYSNIAHVLFCKYGLSSNYSHLLNASSDFGLNSLVFLLEMAFQTFLRGRPLTINLLNVLIFYVTFGLGKTSEPHCWVTDVTEHQSIFTHS